MASINSSDSSVRAPPTQRPPEKDRHLGMSPELPPWMVKTGQLRKKQAELNEVTGQLRDATDKLYFIAQEHGTGSAQYKAQRQEVARLSNRMNALAKEVEQLQKELRLYSPRRPDDVFDPPRKRTDPTPPLPRS